MRRRLQHSARRRAGLDSVRNRHAVNVQPNHWTTRCRVPKRVGPRPGPKAADLVLDGLRGADPVYGALLFLETRRFGGLAFVLGDWRRGTVRDLIDDLQHELGTHLG